jgi:hypothetical protein
MARRPMPMVVDINHWLTERGEIPLKPAQLRANALRVVAFIEAGGPLEVGFTRETVTPCKTRGCPGLMWVAKVSSDRLEAFCRGCEALVVVTGWEHSLWADGPMEPMPLHPES